MIKNVLIKIKKYLLKYVAKIFIRYFILYDFYNILLKITFVLPTSRSYNFFYSNVYFTVFTVTLLKIPGKFQENYISLFESMIQAYRLKSN